MGVLYETSEREIYVPGSPVLGMLGERPGVLREGYGMDYLRREVGVEDGWFVYGAPIENVFVYQPELFAYANLSSDQQYRFWNNTIAYAPYEALAAIGDIMAVARAPLGERRTIFEVPFETWDKEDWVPEFVKELHQLLVADRSEDVLRDDRNDTGVDSKNPHYTEVRLGLLGASTVFLITRSRIARNEQGQGTVARLVELVKLQPETADDILCELSLAEQLRLVEQLLRQQVTQDEWEHVVNNADRRTMRRDHQSVRELAEQYHYVPEISRWHRLMDSLGNLAAKAADSAFIRFLAGEGIQRKHKRDL